MQSPLAAAINFNSNSATSIMLVSFNGLREHEGIPNAVSSSCRNTVVSHAHMSGAPEETVSECSHRRQLHFFGSNYFTRYFGKKMPRRADIKPAWKEGQLRLSPLTPQATHLHSFL